ncbi:chromate efflux transporter [Vibrio aquimaris]|uniref:Putative chromate transport protein n=1 Tax=Vibrio aquimaris TaxID=2587862 RepID=A0A5P9CGE8_9VIBR|nr:chromate efflux transporter [Vibrio aquimaris]QFT25389.1 putative chromate transport protein [Vibrio aquimaris]
MFSIFKTFFWLGWISFGGPAAHIGYFRHTFVDKLGWLDDQEYAQLVALSQFLPGPGSSQVGFAIGYQRQGLLGAILAFIGFTLPSVLIMLCLALLSHKFNQSPLFEGVVHGLKLLAVVVVADATWGMYKSFCKQKLTSGLCLLTAAALLLIPSISTQIILLLFAALIGCKYLASNQSNTHQRFTPSIWPLITFGLLIFALPLMTSGLPLIKLFSDFFQAGSLVFGGGHVVLPLLQNIVGEQISQDAFLTGYAAAQAVPGPMFTFATYIGYQLIPQAPIAGALVATLGVFLPGFLLLLGVLKHWQHLAHVPKVSGALNGVNAAVVGLLLSALYQPVFTSAVLNPSDLVFVLVGFYLLKQLQLPIISIVISFILLGVASNWIV